MSEYTPDDLDKLSADELIDFLSANEGSDNVTDEELQRGGGLVTRNGVAYQQLKDVYGKTIGWLNTSNNEVVSTLPIGSAGGTGVQAGGGASITKQQAIAAIEASGGTVKTAGDIIIGMLPDGGRVVYDPSDLGTRGILYNPTYFEPDKPKEGPPATIELIGADGLPHRFGYNNDSKKFDLDFGATQAAKTEPPTPWWQARQPDFAMRMGDVTAKLDEAKARGLGVTTLPGGIFQVTDPKSGQVTTFEPRKDYASDLLPQASGNNVAPGVKPLSEKSRQFLTTTLNKDAYVTTYQPVTRDIGAAGGFASAPNTPGSGAAIGEGASAPAPAFVNSAMQQHPDWMQFASLDANGLPTVDQNAYAKRKQPVFAAHGADVMLDEPTMATFTGMNTGREQTVFAAEKPGMTERVSFVPGAGGPTSDWQLRDYRPLVEQANQGFAKKKQQGGGNSAVEGLLSERGRRALAILTG